MNRSEGGVEVGDVDAKAKKLLIPVDGSVSSGFIRFYVESARADDLSLSLRPGSSLREKRSSRPCCPRSLPPSRTLSVTF